MPSPRADAPPAPWGRLSIGGSQKRNKREKTRGERAYMRVKEAMEVVEPVDCAAQPALVAKNVVVQCPCCVAYYMSKHETITVQPQNKRKPVISGLAVAEAGSSVLVSFCCRAAARHGRSKIK